MPSLAEQTLMERLRFYFSGLPEATDGEFPEPTATILARLSHLDKRPLALTQLNQLLHLCHRQGVSEGFFRYYFLTTPQAHPYPIDRLELSPPDLPLDGVTSLEHLLWGVHRLFVDALLFFGDLERAVAELGRSSFSELETFFAAHRFDTEALLSREAPLPFQEIPADDKYLISEVACKAYFSEEGKDSWTEEQLLQAYRERGGGRLRIRELFEEGSTLASRDQAAQLTLGFVADEISGAVVSSEEDLRNRILPVLERFHRARTRALQNTRLYLSIVNELDVYVATSMRSRADFRSMHADCKAIFAHKRVAPFLPRYFDPTMSAAEGHEDKGLIECLMVKCAKALLYVAGTRDSYGKDAEVAMALSLGKPVIVLCPPGEEGANRVRFFRDLHPLSRLIDFSSGVAHGSMITQDREVAAELLHRAFSNTMEYDLEQSNGYLRLRERLTRSVVRLQTNSLMLREAFWNYYGGDPQTSDS